MNETNEARLDTIGFAGGGNMAEALIRGLLEAGLVEPDRVYVAEPKPERRDELRQRYGVRVVEDNAELAAACDVVVLAVKPAIVGAVLARWGQLDAARTLVVSVCAGVRMAQLQGLLPAGARVVRAMPNTPAMQLAGATAVAAGSHATTRDMAKATMIFEAVGACVVCEEKHLDAVTGLSGSGPAYVMYLIEALVQGGIEAGLPAAIAQRLASQTVLGAARLQVETGVDPATLRERVSSPGGTTVAGLQALREHGFDKAVVAAIAAATARSIELGGGKAD